MSIHLFDVDYTLLRNSSSYYFLREALQERVLSFAQIRGLPFEWLRYRLGFSNQDFIAQAIKHLRGIPRETLEQVAEQCFSRRMKNQIYQEGRTYIQGLLEQGQELHLATSSFSILVRPLENYLGISESLTSELEFEEGKTSGRLRGPALFGENKKFAVEAWLKRRNIPREELWFYSDSYTDLPLLEFSGHPTAVNPDRFLKRIAERRGWRILRWKETG
jgi:HAD superfamily hydrolase (TIGR01490 family)